MRLRINRSKKTEEDKPKKAPSASAWWRWSNVLHFGFNLVFPFAVLLLVRSSLEPLAILLVLASKWRVFTVKPRHLLANVRANLTDFFVKLGTVIFIIQSQSAFSELAWTLWYVVWLLVIKPKHSKSWMSFQALVGQAIGISALFQFSSNDGSNIYIWRWLLLSLVWVVAYSSARHVLINYDEPWSKVATHLWALFALQLSWILSSWMLVYLFLPQLVLILSAIGYTLLSIYDAAYNNKLKKPFLRQQLIMTSLILIVIILAGDWVGQV